MDFVPFLQANLVAAHLVGDKRLVLLERFFVLCEKFAPVLLIVRQGIMLFHTNQKSLREIQKVVQV